MAISTFKPPDDGRLIRRQLLGRRRIPGSITVEDFRLITGFLEEILRHRQRADSLRGTRRRETQGAAYPPQRER